jgi:hypothetical protein
MYGGLDPSTQSPSIIKITAFASAALTYEKRPSHTQWASSPQLQYFGQSPPNYRAVTVESVCAGHDRTRSDTAQSQTRFRLYTAEIP